MVKSCRKPGNALLKLAQEKHRIDMKGSWMVGDRDLDVVCGKSMGVKTILVQYPHTAEYRKGERADFLAADIREAARIICGAR